MPAGAAVVQRLGHLIAHVFYRIDTVGAVPAEGPLLLLPNHPNALLDPAIVIATAGRPVRFIAKSTLFKSPLAPLLHAADAIPVFRKQDEGADVRRNTATFAAVDEALRQGAAVCIFPEGISHSGGRLEPLRSGAARMALSATRKGVNVQLVPVGINPERKSSFRSRLTIVYGAPSSVDPSSTADALTSQVADRMRAVIVEAAADADAELVRRIDGLYASEREVDDSPAAEIERRRAIAAGLEQLRAADPDRYEAAYLQLRRYDERLRRFRLQDAALDWQISTADVVRFAARELPVALVLGPVALAAAAVFAVPYALTATVGALQRGSDVAATAKVVSGAVFYSAWIAAAAILTGLWRGTAAGIAVAVAMPALAAAGLFAFEREASVLRTVRSWLALRGAHSTTRARLRRHRAELADVIDDVGEWLTR